MPDLVIVSLEGLGSLAHGLPGSRPALIILRSLIAQLSCSGSDAAPLQCILRLFGHTDLLVFACITKLRCKLRAIVAH